MKLHLIFNSETLTCKAFRDPGGQQVRAFSMHDRAVAEGFGHWGRCPRGAYDLGAPVSLHDPAMGEWFIPLLAVAGRSGIGIHGGGSGLGTPFAPRQGWIPTHGCLRVQNEDLKWLAAHLDSGSRITVEGP